MKFDCKKLQVGKGKRHKRYLYQLREVDQATCI